ncbi:MAG: GNAT family N-acetyltransferase [Hyphomicrobiaceae bacterium]|nr:GNAT family N-acetyltransferase [Hyphomicrobiaceae bacterium]
MAKLRTERLTLRPFRRGDACEFARLAGDWAVASMTSDIPYPLTAEQATLWLSPVRGEVRFAIEHEGALVGGAGFYRRASGSAELGFWLGRPWWGRGLASEATREVIRCGFQRHRVPMFTSAHFVDNPASRNVLRKLGFQHAGACEIQCVARGKDVEAMTYWLDRSHAERSIPGVARPAAAIDRLRDLVGWARRGLERTKEPTIS